MEQKGHLTLATQEIQYTVMKQTYDSLIYIKLLFLINTAVFWDMAMYNFVHR
jgi:hypothetical protein